MLIALILAVVIIILDQLTKYFLYGMSCSLIGDFLWLESTLNTGASFGMFKDGTLFFIILTIPMVAIILYCIISKKHGFSNLLKYSMGIILGGTIGNFIDRVALSGVRDFIYFKSINFAIFNVADIAITVGVILLIISIVLEFIKEYKKQKQSKEKEGLLSDQEGKEAEAKTEQDAKDEKEQPKQKKAQEITEDKKQKENQFGAGTETLKSQRAKNKKGKSEE